MNKEYVSWQELEGMSLDLARQIQASNWRPDYIVGITRGGLAPAVLLSNYLDIPMWTLRVSLRDHADTDNSTESNLWMSEDAFNGKNILIVDDINDTGNTINWIRKDWQTSAYPTDTKWASIWGGNVRFAMIYDNLASNAEVEVTYTVREVNKDEDPVWIVFPWEDFWLGPAR